MTFVCKDMRGNWHAEDIVDLPGDRKLKISTSKTFSGSLVTMGIVGRQEGQFFSYTMYQDFSRRLHESRPKKCTENFVKAQHLHVMEDIEDVKKAALFHYVPKVPE